MRLYEPLFYATELSGLFSEKNTLALMLRAEAALATAQAEHGLMPLACAETIARCCDADQLDIEQLKSELPLGGNAAIPLVRQLTALVRAQDPEAAKFVHWGATSQDIVDTATVLQIRALLTWLDAQLTRLETALVYLTREHQHTVMVGRTLLQQAKPITFGLKTAGWLTSATHAKTTLRHLASQALVAQLAGAVGSGNAQLPTPVRHRFAEILGLSPAHSWHTHRGQLAEIAAALGIMVGNFGKIAKDISLLMQTEIAEVSEGPEIRNPKPEIAKGPEIRHPKSEIAKGSEIRNPTSEIAKGSEIRNPTSDIAKGGSSTMPHKRNPVTCAAILANAHQTPFLVAALLAALPQEHERSAGLWHAEWPVWDELLQRSAGTMAHTLQLIEQLEVNPARMRQNLECTNGLIYAESVSLGLSVNLGKATAHERVEKACKMANHTGRHLREVLESEYPDLATAAQLDAWFNPENALGNTIEITTDILNNYGHPV